VNFTFRAFAQTREICNGFPRHHLAFSLNMLPFDLNHGPHICDAPKREQ